MLYLALLLVITCSYPCLCVENRLIPANEDAGGLDRVLQNGDPIHNRDINGTHMYSKRVLRTISVHHNGSVDFNDGYLSIAVFLNQDLNLSTVDAHYIYDNELDEELDYNKNKTYIQNQRDCVIELLENATMCEFNLTDLFVVTWRNYSCTGGENQEEISFQLAVASSSAHTTYALFLYDGSGECDTNVMTGFKRGGDATEYEFPIVQSDNVSTLWESSNVGISGVYIFKITDMPLPPPVQHDNISIVGMVEGGEPSGLLEVCRNCECGSVCDDYWTDRDADVACKQLGFLGYGAEATCKGKFPPNKKVEYILDDVRCNGDENSLFECTHINKEKHNCRNRERAGVNCISSKDDIGIRFWNDTEGQKTEGVIQLQYKGDWRFVCDHMWTVKDAQVACRQRELPCSNAEPCFDGEITTEYWMDYVNCDGDEEALFACSHMGLGVSHGTCKKAGVICK